MNRSSILSCLVACALLVEAIIAQENCTELSDQCHEDVAVSDAHDFSLSLLQRGAKLKTKFSVQDDAKAGVAQSSNSAAASRQKQPWNPALASGVDPWMILTLLLIVFTLCFTVYATVGSLGTSCPPFEDMIASWNMLFDWKLASWNTLAVIFIFMAMYGHYYFMTSPLISTGSTPIGAGYTRLDFIGLVCFIWCLPAAAILGLTSLLSYFSRGKCVVWVIFGAVVCGVFLVYAATQSRDLLACMFCRDCTYCTTENDPEGFRLLSGLEVLLWNAFFFVMFVLISVRACCGKSGPASGSPEPFDADATKYQRIRIFAAGSLAIIINPLLFLFTTIFPNGMTKLAPSAIHAYVSKPSGPAELPTAWMNTTNLRLSEDVVLKFFPDAIIFYSLLEAFALASLATVVFPGLQRFLSTQLIKDFTVGEILSGCALVAATYFWVFYWFVEHSYNGSDSMINDSTLERMFRTWGHTAVLFMSLALLPASKSSIWLKALGVSWEKALWVHRWLGTASLACIICHFLSFWAACIFTYHTFPHDAFAMQLFYPLNGYSTLPSYPNFTIALMQLVAYPSVFMMGISAMKRQGTGNSWEWFKYLHFVFLALIPATLLHAASSPYFLLGGIAFWLFDATLRYAGVADLNTKLLTMEVSNADGGVTKLTFSKTHSEPGQFAWIKVPAISEWEWHPFSLSSSPNDGHSEICVKSMGPNTFTDKLFQLTKASQQDKSKPFKIMVDGPHGIGFGPLLADHASVLLIAGGIGITPMHSTFRTLAQMLQRRPSDSTIQTVKLVWTARSAEMFEVFGDSLDFCLSCSDIMSLALYATGKEKAPSTKGLGVRLSAPVRRHLQLGRPNFDEIMDQTCTSFVLTAERELEQGTCLVLACGPESMVAAAASATRSHQNIDFHNMLFRL